jgi:hypothetical protein
LVKKKNLLRGKKLKISPGKTLSWVIIGPGNICWLGQCPKTSPERAVVYVSTTGRVDGVFYLAGSLLL